MIKGIKFNRHHYDLTFPPSAKKETMPLRNDVAFLIKPGVHQKFQRNIKTSQAGK